MEEETKQKSDSITLNKSTLWKAGTFIFAALFLFVLFSGGFKSNGNVVQVPDDQIAPTNIKVQIDNTDPILGNANAEISIIEFSDFQCPFCGRVFTGAITEFKNSDYFKSGKVNLVYKHFPLNSIHPYAQKSAEASVCAQNQGKFWEYHDVLFTNQETLDIVSLKKYAADLKLDTTKFNNCLDNSDAKSKVAKDLTQATTAGGQGTPYFVIINHKTGDKIPVSGAVPWANFEAAINSLI